MGGGRGAIELCNRTRGVEKEEKKEQVKKKGGIARKLYPRFLSSDLKATALFEKENSDGPRCFPLPFTSHLDDNCVDDSASGEARTKSNAQRAPARTIMAFCVSICIDEDSLVLQAIENESRDRSLITRNNRKIPFPVPCVSVETFLVVSEFFNAIRKFEL